MVVRRFAAALVILFLFAAIAARADCRVHTGDHVILFGTSDDPDVFVWDSRFRLRAYQGGTWDQANALLRHASLAPPGTRAIVSMCVVNFVQPKYGGEPDDAIGIVIVSGKLRGKSGWVMGADIRGVYHSIAGKRTGIRLR